MKLRLALQAVISPGHCTLSVLTTSCKHGFGNSETCKKSCQSLDARLCAPHAYGWQCRRLLGSRRGASALCRRLHGKLVRCQAAGTCRVSGGELAPCRGSAALQVLAPGTSASWRSLRRRVRACIQTPASCSVLKHGLMHGATSSHDHRWWALAETNLACMLFTEHKRLRQAETLLHRDVLLPPSTLVLPLNGA